VFCPAIRQNFLNTEKGKKAPLAIRIVNPDENVWTTFSRRTLTALTTTSTIRPTGVRLALASPLIPTLYPHGTYCAAAGLIVVALHYDHAWRHFRHRSDSSPLPPAAVDPTLDSFPERRYLYWGMAISVACFLLAGAADAPNDLPDRLVGAMMGLCGALFAGMFGFGLVSLWNLWKEALLQGKSAVKLRHLVKSKGIKTPSVLRTIFFTILWLASVIGVFIALGFLIDFIPKSRLQDLPDLPQLRTLRDLQEAFWAASKSHLTRHFLMLPIAAMFYFLWKSRTYAGLIARFILLFGFSAVILAFTGLLLAWAALQTAPALVTSLAVVATLNTLFYARWVRHKALSFNLE
jgi:hypothetical protein